MADSQPRPAPRAGGGSRIGDDFLKGPANADNRGKSQTPTGPVITGQIRSSLLAEVSHLPAGDWRIGAPFFMSSALALVALVLAAWHFARQPLPAAPHIGDSGRVGGLGH